MRWLFILGLLICNSGLFLQAQTKTVKFGQISKKELNEKFYLGDSTVEAAILYDYGKSYIDEAMYLNKERHIRLKIYKKSGVWWADKVLSEIGDPYRVIYNHKIEGYSYNLEDGKIVKSQLNKYEEETSNVRKAVFQAFPDVRVGTIVDLFYTYKVKDLKSYYWDFQNTIPTKWSEYVAVVPSFLEYQLIYEGYKKFDIEEDYREPKNRNMVGGPKYHNNIYRFVLKSIPAFQETDFISTPKDYVNRMRLQLSSYEFYTLLKKDAIDSWPKLKKYLLNQENLRTYFKKNKQVKELTQDFVQDSMTGLEKLVKVYDHIRNHFEWDGTYDIYAEQRIKELLQKKEGNAADINLLLLATLREVGISADPVVISTRNHGKVYKKVPFLDDFNHILVRAKVAEKHILLDATDPERPYQLLPPAVFNGEGLLVNDSEQIQWIPIKSNLRHSQLFELNYVFDFENHTLKGELQNTFTNYAALEISKILNKKTPEKYKSELKNKFVEGDVYNIKIERNDDLMEGVNVEFDFKGNLDKNAEGVYFNPFLGLGMQENPLKAAQRSIPLDFNYPKEETYIVNFEIPEGYQMPELPDSYNYVLSDETAFFRYNVSRLGRMIRIISHFRLSEFVYPASIYPELKLLFDKVIEKHSIEILLQKESK